MGMYMNAELEHRRRFTPSAYARLSYLHTDTPGHRESHCMSQRSKARESLAKSLETVDVIREHASPLGHLAQVAMGVVEELVRGDVRVWRQDEWCLQAWLAAKDTWRDLPRRTANEIELRDEALLANVYVNLHTSILACFHTLHASILACFHTCMTRVRGCGITAR